MDRGLRARIEQAVASQGFTRLLGAELVGLTHGRARLRLERRADLLQQHGFLHGGVVAYLVDNSATIAAATVMPEGADVLTAEYKLNLLRPAAERHLLAEAVVVRPGRRLVVVEVGVHASAECPGADERLDPASRVAVALATVAVVSTDEVRG